MEIKARKTVLGLGKALFAILALHVVSFCWLKFLTVAREQAAEASVRAANSLGFVRPEQLHQELPADITPEDYMIDQARRYIINPSFARALIECESGFDPDAKSEKGALGLMQVVPSTAKLYGWDGVSSLTDPYNNIDWGMVRLADALRETGGNAEQAVWHYHGGPKGVDRIKQCGERNWKCLGTEYSKSVRHADCVMAKMVRDIPLS